MGIFAVGVAAADKLPATGVIEWHMRIIYDDLNKYLRQNVWLIHLVHYHHW